MHHMRSEIKRHGHEIGEAHERIDQILARDRMSGYVVGAIVGLLGGWAIWS